jgi:hypothetical protein
MTSSNSYNFSVTRDNLITDALLYIGAIAESETPTSAAVSEAARLLNMIVKLRAADGMPLWALKRATILPETGVSSMNTTGHIVSSYVNTTISVDEASAQTVLSVTSSTGMTAGDQVGIEMDDGTMHWTTIVSVDSSTQITVTTAIDDEAGSGNQVFSYTASTARIARPLRVLDANMLNVDSDSSWEITTEERSDYFNLGNRTTEGTPNRIYYDATLGDATTDPTSSSTWYGTFYIYPRFDGGDHVIEFTYQRPFQDFDAAGDHPDFPQEFYLPIMLELAALSGAKYGLPLDERKALHQEAKMYREEALATVAPEGSLFLQPEDENS